MICPYCGCETDSVDREHYYPKSAYWNDWDFLACKKCNQIKGQHIVYPDSRIFKYRPKEFNRKKFEDLWKLSSWHKYLAIAPVKQMLDSFEKRKWSYGTYQYSTEEKLFYGLYDLRKIYVYVSDLYATLPSVCAVVMCPDHKLFYVLTTQACPRATLVKGVVITHIHDFMDMRATGWLICGSAAHGLWKQTTNYIEYFRDLLDYRRLISNAG